jgi:hypothetical protein
MTDFDGVPDPAMRLQVQTLAEQLDVQVDVDAAWDDLVRRLADERRPSVLPRLVAVAAAVLLLVFVVRPVVVTGAQAAVRYVVDKVDEVITGSLGERPPVAAPTTTTPVTVAPVPLALPPAASPVPSTTTTTEPVVATTVPDAHGTIAVGDDYRLVVRSVHGQINDAVGFGRWNPAALQGAPERLEAIVDDDPELTELVRSAIDLLHRAIDGPDRDMAIYAHRIIEEIERQRAGRTTG